MAKEAHNRMEVQSERISPKQVVLTVDLYSDLADTAFLTLDETQSQTATLEDGHVQIEFPLSDEQSRLHLHTVTAEFFSGENPESLGAMEKRSQRDRMPSKERPCSPEFVTNSSGAMGQKRI